MCVSWDAGPATAEGICDFSFISASQIYEFFCMGTLQKILKDSDPEISDSLVEHSVNT